MNASASKTSHKSPGKLLPPPSPGKALHKAAPTAAPVQKGPMKALKVGSDSLTITNSVLEKKRGKITTLDSLIFYQADPRGTLPVTLLPTLSSLKVLMPRPQLPRRRRLVSRFVTLTPSPPTSTA